MFISEIIDNKLKKLKGTYKYPMLLKILASEFVSYEYDEALNYLRQSIYRLKREGFVYKEKDGSFSFNSENKWTPPSRVALSLLVKKGLTADSKNSLLYKYKLIDQIPATKSIVVQRRHGNIKNDLKVEISYTKYSFEKNEKLFFELAKLFEQTYYNHNDFKIIYKVINENTKDFLYAINKIKKFIAKNKISKYDYFVDWYKNRMGRFSDE